MINAHQNMLLIATMLALLIIFFVHVFLFPVYVVDVKRTASKRYFDLEQSLCVGYLKRRRTWQQRVACPKCAIVTVVHGGRLGNQMWEYAAVWAIARRTGLEPFVPRCILLSLEDVFEALSVPSLEEIAYCALGTCEMVHELHRWQLNNQSIVLPRYSLLADIVLAWSADIVQEFTIRRKWRNKSQQVLRAAAEWVFGSNSSEVTFVGVHVRRTDYMAYIWRRFKAVPADADFYLSAMRHFRKKYAYVVFVVISDDPRWCHQKLSAEPALDVWLPSRMPKAPALDLAILAACNHSIFDYGTFGGWGAILAGGETIYYNLSGHSSGTIGQLLPNWMAMG